MHNTVGDVALTNIRRLETNYFHDFVQYPRQKLFAVSQPQNVPRMFLNFGHFSVSGSYKKDSYINKECKQSHKFEAVS